jgi:glycosyltransferase involved in cell wall biosynthesis
MKNLKRICVDYARGEVILPEILRRLPAVRYISVAPFADGNLQKAEFFLTFEEHLQEQFPNIQCRTSPAFDVWLAANMPVLRPGKACEQPTPERIERARREQPSPLDGGEGLTREMEEYFREHPELSGAFSLDSARSRLAFVIRYLREQKKYALPYWAWLALCARRQILLDGGVLFPLPLYAAGLLPFTRRGEAYAASTHAKARKVLGSFIHETLPWLRQWELPPSLDFLAYPDPAVREAEEQGVSMLFSALAGNENIHTPDAAAVSAFLKRCRSLPGSLRPQAWQLRSWERKGLLPSPAAVPFLKQRRASELSILGWGDAVMGIGEDQRVLKRALDTTGVKSETVVVSRLVPHHSKRCDWKTAKQNGPRGMFAVICLAAQDIYRLWAASPKNWWAGRRIIGLCPWELPAWPSSARRYLTVIDEIWAPSSFAARAFLECGKQTAYIPHAVIPPEPVGDLRGELGITGKETVFLTSFDTGASCLRKNPLAVLRAFNAAFAGRNLPARLIVKTMRADWDSAYWRILHDENRCGDAVIFIDDIFSAARNAALLNTCDAFVSLHRSEGFGRLLAEAMTLGKLLIASDFGGNTDFTTPETACPVSGKLVDVEPGEYLFGEGQQWFEADIEHAAHHMRAFAENPAQFAALAANGKRHILTHHSPDAVGRLARAALIKSGMLAG